jgi:prepilin-type N-terminal cleavage/methylation domain-containing protein
MNKQQSKGFTIIEILVALVILTTLMLMLMPVFSYSRKTVSTMNKLDIYHETRKIGHELNSSLKLATEVIFPDPEAKHSWKNCVIFRNPLNQVIICYVNDKSQLVAINYDQIRRGKVIGGKTIATGVESFRVNRKESNLIEFKVNLKTETGKALEFAGMVNLANLI